MHNLRAMLNGSTILRAPDGPEGGGAPAPAATTAALAVETPAAAAPAAAPVETSTAPAPDAAPAAPEPAKPAETAEPAKPAEGDKPAVDAKPDEKKLGLDKPSLLTPKPEEKPADKAADAKPAEPAAPVEVKPTYEPFKLPEGVKADDELTAKFTDLIGGNKLTQEQGQALIDLHTGAMQKYADHMLSEQWRVHNEMRQGWQDEVRKDPVIGGNKFETSIQNAMKMIEVLVPKDRREAFTNMLELTGAGDHPEFHRFMHSIAQWLNEPIAPKPPAKPAKGNGKAPGPRGLRAMYADKAAQ